MIIQDDAMASMKLLDDSIVVIDKGVKNMRNGSIALVSRYDIVKFAKVTRLPSHILLETGDKSETVPYEEEEQGIFEIIGPAIEEKLLL